MKDVLLLNADFAPVDVLGWERAVALVLSCKVRTVEAWPERFVRSPSASLPWPAVVALVRYARWRGGECRIPGPLPAGLTLSLHRGASCGSEN